MEYGDGQEEPSGDQPFPQPRLMCCLQTGKHYPDYSSGVKQLRYCGEGDIIFVEEADVRDLLERGLCKRYE